MRLRQACKICENVWGPVIVFRNYRYSTVAEARRVCQRAERRRTRIRLPYIPSDAEQAEMLEIHGLVLFHLAEVMGMPADEVEAERREFLRVVDNEKGW